MGETPSAQWPLPSPSWSQPPRTHAETPRDYEVLIEGYMFSSMPIMLYGLLFWIPIIMRHLIFEVPKKDHNFDNKPYFETSKSSSGETCWTSPGRKYLKVPGRHVTNSRRL